MSDKPLLPQEERVFRMWEPLPFSVGEDYDYLRRGFFKRLGSGLLTAVVSLILGVFNRLAFGMRIDGRENLRALDGRGAVSVCNHIHQMDCTMARLALLPKRVYLLSLDSNFRIPVVRHIIRWLGAVPVSRDPQQIRTLFDRMGDALQAGDMVHIYPEGVLVPYDAGLRGFHNGAFRIAVDNNAPVLPMAIVQAQPRGLLRLIKRKPCLHLHILPPVYPSQTLARRKAIVDLHDRCRAAMEQALRDSQAE